MTAALYDLGREAFAQGLIDWNADDIRIALIDTALYTVDLANHDFLDDVAVGSRVAVSAASLAGKASPAGVCDATDHVISSVSGATIEAFIIYKHTGSDATARLIAYLDQASVTGLPLTPNGGDVTIAFDNGANRIFKL
jgi:hypothetical protein